MSLEVQYIRDINPEELNNLTKNSSSSWFQHTDQWCEYSLNMREGGSSDFSFGVFQNNKLVAFSPLVKEYIYDSQEKNEFSMAGFPSVYPTFSNTLSKNNKDKIEKLTFEQILQIAKDEDISYMNFYVFPLSDVILNKEMIVNPLSKFGFHDTTISTNILSLDKDEDVLFRNFRKGTIQFLDNPINGIKQIEEDATYFKRRTEQQSEITIEDICNKPSDYLYNKIRMLQSPYPNAFIRTIDGKKLALLDAKIE